MEELDSKVLVSSTQWPIAISELNVTEWLGAQVISLVTPRPSCNHWQVSSDQDSRICITTCARWIGEFAKTSKDHWCYSLSENCRHACMGPGLFDVDTEKFRCPIIMFDSLQRK